jgi:hypothetical protein
VAAVLLEAESSQDLAPPEEEVFQDRVTEFGAEEQQGGPPLIDPRSPEGARAALVAAVADGMSRADLAALVIRLGRDCELSPTQLQGLLRAVQAEHEDAQSIAAESQRLVQAADSREIGAQLLALDAILPAPMAAAAARLIEFLPADDITAIGCILSAAAAVQKLGSTVTASARIGWRAPLNLYTAIVGRSGVKKDPVMNALFKKPLAPIQAGLIRNNKNEISRWESENLCKKPAERTKPPQPVYLITSNYTGEALDFQFAQQESRGLGLTISRPEISGLFSSLNQYRQGADEQQLLEAYDGGSATVLRIGSDAGARCYEKCHLSIFGAIPPLVLTELLTRGDASGLWARFWFVPVPNRIVLLPHEDSPEEEEITNQAEQFMADAMARLYRLQRQDLRVSPEALDYLMTYEGRCQHDAKSSALGAMEAAWSKAPGRVLRVAGLLHLLHQVSPGGEISEKISLAMMIRACNLTDHMTSWALGLHEAAAGGETSDLMRRIHSRAQAMSTPIGWREFYQGLSAQQRKGLDSAAAGAAVDALVALGVGERLDGARPGSWRYRATGDLPG